MVLEYFNKTKTYHTGFESFCYQNCLQYLLEASGIENPCLYLNASMSMIIQKEDDNMLNFSTQKGIRNLLPEFTDNVKRVYYDAEDDTEKIFTENIKFISRNNQPIVVGVDVYYLPYTQFYLKTHAMLLSSFFVTLMAKKISIFQIAVYYAAILA